VSKAALIGQNSCPTLNKKWKSFRSSTRSLRLFFILLWFRNDFEGAQCLLNCSCVFSRFRLWWMWGAGLSSTPPLCVVHLWYSVFLVSGVFQWSGNERSITLLFLWQEKHDNIWFSRCRIIAEWQAYMDYYFLDPTSLVSYNYTTRNLYIRRVFCLSNSVLW